MLENIFEKVEKMEFVDCKEGYIVYTEKCKAIIGIKEDEVVMSFIISFQKGGGTDMLDKLEKFAESIGKSFVVSNIISPKLRRMVEKRGYERDMVPFSPEFRIMDLVEVYIKRFEKQPVIREQIQYAHR